MGRNTYRAAVIDERRRHVARLRLRGLTQREIMVGLEKADQVDPKTGKPYSLGTINSDIKALEAEWKANALGDIAQHKGNHLAKLGEAYRVAWNDSKGPRLFYVLKALEQEMKVLGLDEHSTDTSDTDRAIGDFRAGAAAMLQLHAEKKVQSDGMVDERRDNNGNG